MAKIRLQRETGRPVELDKLEQYEAEFKAKFDVIQEAVGQDMLLFHSQLIELDKELSAKYEQIVEVEMPKNNKQWEALLLKYECPVMVARILDPPHKLTIVICDKPFG